MWGFLVFKFLVFKFSIYTAGPRLRCLCFPPLVGVGLLSVSSVSLVPPLIHYFCFILFFYFVC